MAALAVTREEALAQQSKCSTPLPHPQALVTRMFGLPAEELAKRHGDL